jgi:hypothetical protein
VASGAPSVGTEGQEVVDYSSWPIKELRRFCSERGVVSAGGV